MARMTVTYARISADRQGLALGVDRQQRECEALCKARRWKVGMAFVDNNRSAYSGRVRPEYRRLLQAISDGLVERVVAWDPDRLHRSPIELEEFIALVEKHGVKVETVNAGLWDLTTPAGRMVARQLGSVARYESEHRSDRLRLKLAENANTGRPHGRRAFGWDRSRDSAGHTVETINAPEAALIRSAAADIISGASLASVARAWAASGVRPTGGDTWHKASVRHVLMRERNAGLRVHHGQVIGEAAWEAILDVGTYEQMKAVLADPARRTSTGTAAKHLVSGIAKCGVCGHVVHAARNRQTEAYRCKGRGCVARNRADVDALVTEVTLTYLERANLAELLGTERAGATDAARNEAEQLRARLDLAADQFADGTIDARQLARITARLRPDIEAAEARAVATADTSAAAALAAKGDVRAAWAAASLTQRRAVVASLMGIRINRAKQGARVFDPETVGIDWKTGVASA